MKRRTKLTVAFFLTWLFGSTLGVGGLLAVERPNVLFIICDDLNNTVEGMGEKDLLIKKTVWEESTRVPLVICAPGVAKPNQQCEQPVSLVDLYPTLIDLCGLPNELNREGNKRPLDGSSLRPLMADPTRDVWDELPVTLSVIGGGDPVEIAPVERQHFTVRSRHWRYCLWANGEEELYDHRADPHEWHNLAADPEQTKIKAELREEMRKLTGR